VTIFWGVNFSAVHNVFDDAGELRDTAFLPRIDTFLRELICVASTWTSAFRHRLSAGWPDTKRAAHSDELADVVGGVVGREQDGAQICLVPFARRHRRRQIFDVTGDAFQRLP
jgi:hypothetical protein